MWMSLIAPIAAFAFERYVLGVRSTEQNWKEYLAFMVKTKFWSELPAKKRARHRARIINLASRSSQINWQRVLEEKEKKALTERNKQNEKLS